MATKPSVEALCYLRKKIKIKAFSQQENHCSITNRTSSCSIQFPINNKKSILVFSSKRQTHKDKILVKGANKTILIATAIVK